MATFLFGMFRVREIIERETDVVRAQLTRNGISMYQGLALFLDPHTLTVQDGEDGHQLKAKNILIACGTRPAHSREKQSSWAPVSWGSNMGLLWLLWAPELR